MQTEKETLKVKFIIPEEIAVKKLKEYIDECDSDEIARLLGETFGGDCNYNAELITYDFTPNKYYGGEFDNFIK